jgi:uncharacterized protein with HEPN domain
MKRDDAALLDIAQATRLAIEFVKEMNEHQFEKDLKTQSAVLHQLMVLGEAVKRLSPEYRDAHKEIPWREIAGLRDKLIHAYDSIDINQVWRVLTTDLPALCKQTNPLLPATK